MTAESNTEDKRQYAIRDAECETYLSALWAKDHAILPHEKQLVRDAFNAGWDARKRIEYDALTYMTKPQAPPAPPRYTCPVCGVADSNAYLRCNRPDCTDGRDPRPATT